MIDSRGIPLEVQRKANKLGYTVYLSHRKGKRFYVIYNNKKIHFGLKGGSTFVDHHDKDKKKAWRARHSKILIDGKPAYKIRSSPEYWVWAILW